MVAPSIIKIFSIAVLATFLVSSVEPTDDCPSVKAATSGKMDKYIVMFKKDDSNAAKNHFDMMKRCYNKKVASVKPNGKGSTKMDKNTLMDFSVASLQGYSGMFTESFASALPKMKGVTLVEKDGKVQTKYAVPRNLNLTRRAEDNSPTPNIDRIDQAKFPLDGKYVFPDSAGKGVNIFVVDTGVLVTHSEFSGRATFGAAFCSGCNDQDENGHGTHVSSLAAGKTLGVARSANIIGVRVLDANGAGSNTDVINGLSFVLKQHNGGKNKNTVVSMSLGGGFSAAVNSAVKDLTDAGAHVVVAAGNESQDACKSSPSSEPTAITVGATEDKNDDITDFSNIGKCVDIFAPGRNIEGAGIKNDNDHAVFSGTSQATPHVSGTVALIIADSGNLSPADMAKKLNDLSTKGVVKEVGGGDLTGGNPDSFVRIPAA